MKKDLQRVATTVKIENSLYEQFRTVGSRNRLTLQKLADKVIFRYVRDEVFRNDINNYNLPHDFYVKSSEPSSSVSPQI